MKPPATEAPAPRPKQELSSLVVNDLLRVIRSQFCPDVSDKEWFQGHYHFIRQKVVLWPCGFMAKKGFTLPVERYQAIFLAVLHEIKKHGQTGQVRYWPGYLLSCVQSHWKHHWEDYYREAKAVRSTADLLLAGVQRLAQEATPASETTEPLAIGYSLLVRAKGKRRAKPARSEQLPLLPL